MEQLEKDAVEYIVLHHSERSHDSPFFIKLRHKYFRNWSDTGYHFIIGNGIYSKNGKIYSARPVHFVGAHTFGYNQKSIGICLIGNFDYSEPSFKQYRSLIRLIIQLKLEFKNIKAIIAHNEAKDCKKTCPGKLFPTERFNKLIQNQLS